MFWDKGYTPSQNIEALLEKENSIVEEFLDDEDILQECKTLKKNIVNYFTRPEVIKRLVELITTEPSEELPMTQRFHYANMACEILTLGLPSLDEKLMSDASTLKTLYSYLENKPPLNPLLSSFFSKAFSMLFTKKAEQDWFLYQQMCLQLLEYIKSQKNFLDLICKHFDTPIIPDLIMQMMRDVEGGQLKRNLYEWLTDDKLVERLIVILRNPQETDKHANVAEFLCDLIQQGRSMRQTDQENDSFEPAFEGSNPLLKQIESVDNIEALLNVILEPNAVESAIVSGISVVLTLIKPVVFTDEPNSDRIKYLQNREREIHEGMQETVIGVIVPHLQKLTELLKNPPKKPDIETTVTTLSPPFGKTRLQICRIFTALLETKNEAVSKALCETGFFELLIGLFKEYCWNNFLHSEVEKCLHIVFYSHLANASNQNSTQCSDGSYNKASNNDDYGFNYFLKTTDDGDEYSGGDGSGDSSNGGDGENETSKTPNETAEMSSEDENASIEENESIDQIAAEEQTESDKDATRVDKCNNEMGTETVAIAESEVKKSDEEASMEGTVNETYNTKVPESTPPSEMQTHLIVNCRLLTKLVDCWQYNQEVESSKIGRRLGYMGHLIQIIKHITNSISESEHISALIESNFSDESEFKLWQSIIDPNDGEFSKALNMQNKMLANCNPHEEGDYSQHLPKDFLTDNNTLDFIMRSNVLNLGAFNDTNMSDIVFALDDDHNLFQFGRNLDDDDDDDENATAGGGDGQSGLFTKSSLSLAWGSGAEFGSDNFADFDAHFSSFSNDLGACIGEDSPSTRTATTTEQTMAMQTNVDNNETEDNNEMQNSSESNGITNEQPANRSNLKNIEELSNKDASEYDNNANLEKFHTRKISDGDNVEYNMITPVPKSIVNRLQCVLLDGEDDYEDDEGMWTKPLGGSGEGGTGSGSGSSDSSTENEHSEQRDDASVKKPISTEVLINGPSKQCEELNNSIEKNITNENQEQSGLDIKLSAKNLPITNNSVEVNAKMT